MLKKTRLESIAAIVVASAWLLCPAPDATADLLDRIREKADEVADEARSLRQDVEDVTTADERLENEIGAAGRSVEAEVEQRTDVEGRLRDEAERSEAGQAVAETERAVQRADNEVDRIATTDERAVAEVRREAGRIESEVERATDVEGRVEGAVRSSELGGQVAEAERDLAAAERDADALASADETVQDRVTEEPRRTGNAVENAVDEVRELGQAFDD